MFFKYFILTSCCIFILKGTFRGLTSSAISLAFTVLAALFSLLLYKPSFIMMFVSVVAFCAIQAFGLYIASKYKRTGIFQYTGGLFIGILEFAVILTLITSLALAFNLASKEFLENEMVQTILPYASKIQSLFINLAA